MLQIEYSMYSRHITQLCIYLALIFIDDLVGQYKYKYNIYQNTSTNVYYKICIANV